MQFINREEKENLQRLLSRLCGLDALHEESEQQLAAILQRFDVVPKTEVKRALMEWKVKWWQDVITWRLTP